VRISAAGATLSADAPGPAIPAGARLSIDVVDADLHHVLRLISAASGLSFVVDDGVSARVTVRLVDVPWDHALAAILAAHGLTTQPLSGGGVQVRPLAP
jgi:type IV pilus assembly protein PilQ